MGNGWNLPQYALEFVQIDWRGDSELKEWQCVEVEHHKDVGKTIEDYERKGWRLHSYTCSGIYIPIATVKHYLLFERGR